MSLMPFVVLAYRGKCLCPTKILNQYCVPIIALCSTDAYFVWSYEDYVKQQQHVAYME